MRFKTWPRICPWPSGPATSRKYLRVLAPKFTLFRIWNPATLADMETVLRILVEGQEVRCYQSEGHRLWQCQCAAYQRRLEQYGEGFCAHTAVVIMRCLEA